MEKIIIRDRIHKTTNNIFKCSTFSLKHILEEVFIVMIFIQHHFTINKNFIPLKIFQCNGFTKMELFHSTEVVRVRMYSSNKTTETLNMNSKSNVDKANFLLIGTHNDIKWFIKFSQCEKWHLSNWCSTAQNASHIWAVNNLRIFH